MNTAASPLRTIDPARLKSWLGDGHELALLDVREHGQYGEGHLFFGVNVPFSRLEIEAPRLVPNPGVRVVLYDAGDGVGDRARAVMETMGYTDIHVLKGGAPAWREAGFRLFAGVNLPSKTFGELAEHVLGTPRIAAADLAERLERGDDLRVVDGRTFAEFQKMSIPGATSCPNGELALRIDDLVGDPHTTIVVNCAGRTRSIIGAQTLIDLGLPNAVLALENGTQGWFLADLPLEHGAMRRHAMSLADGAMQARRRRALDRAARTGVRLIEAAEVQAWLADPARTTYLCDVRTPEEFAAGSLPGAQHCPGGQLIQATDLYVGVQNARMVLFDAELVRAPVVAAWLVQMGWEVAVLTGGLDAGLRGDLGGHLDPGRAERALPPIPAALDLSQLIEGRGEGRVLLDIRPGQSFRAGHVEDAIWSIRPALGTLRLTPGDPVILIADSLEMGALAARTLRELGIPVQGVHTGSPEDWRRAGLPVAATPGDPSDRACIDYLFFVHDRHDGNKEAARQYLAWETDLIHRIDAQERARFTFHAPPPTGEF